jgi:hypothetical protein
MFNLIHGQAASEQLADRLRRAESARLAQQARSRVEQAHRREVERVRESVLLVPRRGADASREG